MNKVHRGKLLFLRWSDPWMIETYDDRFDFSGDFWAAVEGLENSPAKSDITPETLSISLGCDEDRTLTSGGRGNGVVLSSTDPKAWGFQNLASYVELTLQALNGRYIEVEFGDKFFSIKPMENEAVHAVRRIDGSNFCRIEEGDEGRVCGLGHGPGRCCVFITADAEGLKCAKFEGPMTRHILDRVKQGTMNARRIGDCRKLRREEEAT